MNTKYLTKRSDAVSLMVVVGHLMVVLSPIYVAAAMGPGWHTVLWWFLFGISMNGILNLMHECAHTHVFKDRKWSDVLGKRVVAPMVFADFDAYRRRHWDHHKFIGQEGETKDTYLIDIRGLGLLKAFARCAFMAEAARKFLKQKVGRDTTDPVGRAWLIDLLIFQLVFSVSLLLTARAFNADRSWAAALLHAVSAYGLVYLYGLMSLTVFMASLRAIAEHQVYDTTSTRSGYAALRNFTCNPLSRFLMGAYGFGEHYTHHRAPAIPYYRLQAATTEMAQQEPSLRPDKDYFRVLVEILTRRASPDRVTGDM
jgi:fatty acid desaturase